MSSDQMEQRMSEAAKRGNIDELNDLIGNNGLILEEMALKGAGHTPLHVACVAGHLAFVRELLKLKPKFAEKVNADGFSPLHIAAAGGDVEITRELLQVGQHLCSMKGRERRIPLHYAVINGELNVMKLLLHAWPDCIEETTAQEETALHLAVKSNRFEAFVELVEHLKQNKKEHVINWKDHEGNTALHLAVAGKNFEVVKFMLHGLALESEVVDVNASNESGSTPLDVLTPSQTGAGDREIRKILSQAGARHGRGRSNLPAARPVSGDDNNIEGDNSHRSDGEPATNSPQSSSRSESKHQNKEGKQWEKVNAVLVVAALIASATYQSVLQPPSSVEFPKVDKNDMTAANSPSVAIEETIVYGTSLVYLVLLGGNSFGFLVSVQILICLTEVLPLKQPLRLSLVAMVQSYFCFVLSLLITSDQGVPAVLRLTPLVVAVFFIPMQKYLAKIIDFSLEWLFKFKLFDKMYHLDMEEKRT